MFLSKKNLQFDYLYLAYPRICSIFILKIKNFYNRQLVWQNDKNIVTRNSNNCYKNSTQPNSTQMFFSHVI